MIDMKINELLGGDPAEAHKPLIMNRAVVYVEQVVRLWNNDRAQVNLQAREIVAHLINAGFINGRVTNDGIPLED